MIKSRIIGIDGLGGSGKTTYAKRLQEKDPHAVLFHLDDFIHPIHIRYNDQFEEWVCYYRLQWRYDYLIEKILGPLTEGRAVKDVIEFYDKERDQYVEREVMIEPGSTVIIEGVFLQRPELRPYFDHVTFLDVDRDTRWRRAVHRDHYIGDAAAIIEKYMNRYGPAEQYYVEQCNPLLLADEVIYRKNGSRF